MTALVVTTASQAPVPAAASTSSRLLRLLSPLPAFDMFLPDDPGRYPAMQYIAEQFKAAHGASVHDFMPLLLGMSCQGQFSAASGIRPATHHPLFSEQYLDQPVQSVLGEITGTPVRRSQVAEIGNLVATQSGASQLLFLLLTVMLHRAGFDWVVFTGTPVVIRGLERLGFRLDRLCAADPARLTSSRLEDWGQYYQQRPEVVAGNVPDAIRILAEHKLYTAALALFENRISQLAAALRTPGLPYGTHAVAA